MIVVVAASVTVKWYVSENCTTEAEKLLDGSYKLYAPELILPEFGNIIWKKLRRNDLTDQEANQIMNAFRQQSITFRSHQSLLKAAFTGTQLSGQTVYDWSYLALAVSLSCEFVTADVKFYKALKKNSLKKHHLWIGDI